ncbi:MAG TPA: class I SAM-dependent methyltransferase [Verrucomicrobiae bacterium]|nr:class I SAM-dependent methyltransferase [Verrucomicrobiae bacterium]
MEVIATNHYWDAMAEHFQFQQAPLRPSAEDIELIENTLADWRSRHPSQSLNVLLLGVTPEIAGLNWPENSHLLAIERSRPMIDRFWIGDVPGRRNVRCANWFEVEIPEASIDVVIGDGVLTPLAFPTQYRQMAERIAHWLKPSGILNLRVFARTERAESMSHISADLKAGRIPRFDILKWRIAMALQRDVGGGVMLADIHQAWEKLEREHPLEIENAGWPRQTINTIQLYAGRPARYSFPTVAELDEAFSPALKRQSVRVPKYVFGECCPTLIYQRVC